MKKMDHLCLTSCLCEREVLKLENSTKQEKVLCKVCREAPKQAKAKFWRVVVARTT